MSDPACGHGPTCSYGFFPGGDPREFSPDEECCSADEVSAWEAACARWNAGEPKDEGHSGVIIPGVGIMCGHRFGIGTYTLPCDCGGDGTCGHEDVEDGGDEISAWQTCKECGSSRGVFAGGVGEWRAA